MITLAEVGAGGLVGAPARYLVDQLVLARGDGLFPWGTWTVNVTGSFVLGLVTGLAMYHGLGAVASNLVGTGFCGAYTTFSTFSWETMQLVEEGALKAAAANVASSLVAGLLAGAAGMALAYLI